VAASPYDEVRAAYIAERPTYQALCDRSVELLRTGLREKGIRNEVTSRVKDVISYLAKVLRNPDYLSGARAIQDKAGVRIILPYIDEEPAVAAVIERIFEVDEREDTIDRLGADRLGYLGVHYIARLQADVLSPEEQTLFDGRQLEIQVGSMAQRTWADVSHELIYKGSLHLPEAYERIINRLISLVELFDSEVGRVRERIAALPGFEVTPLLTDLDRELLRFSGRRPDRALSQQIVPPLAALYPEPPAEVFPTRIGPWIDGHRERLQELYARYGIDFDNPIFFQPEAFLIFERAENDQTGLRDAWPGSLPRDLLVSMTELWGDPIA
jgi:ppGpp synthetase/RelA/SpoT-type nucleotidyltranferase